LVPTLIVHRVLTPGRHGNHIGTVSAFYSISRLDFDKLSLDLLLQPMGLVFVYNFENFVIDASH